MVCCWDPIVVSLKSRGTEKKISKKNCERVMKVGTKDILKQKKIEKLCTDAGWY